MTQLAAPPGAVERRKALGQYFTGVPLARLLASLAKTGAMPRAVVDPMSGIGDMLVAVDEVLGRGPELLGVDIDRDVIATAESRPDRPQAARFVIGNAFDTRTWANLAWPAFDLVIANPPYVRYQTLSSGGTFGAPPAAEVRRGLWGIGARLPHLLPEDRSLFLQAIESYSGLSDMAVPSWILCAMLLNVGGSLAMVVPETWLSRAYAAPIQLMLAKLFRVRCVVEDTGRVWFSDAQVKTHLVVADRIHREATSMEPTEMRTVFVSLPPAAAAGSLVGALYPTEAEPDRLFARDVRSAFGDDSARSGHRVPFEYSIRDLLDERAALRNEDHTASAVRAGVNGRAAEPFVPHGLRSLIAGAESRLVTFEQLGVRAGQGLRTGANAFFYGDAVDTSHASDAEGMLRLRTHRLFGGREVSVPQDAVRTAIRAQSELTQPQRALVPHDLAGRVLTLAGWALPEDADAYRTEATKVGTPSSDVRVLPPALASHIRQAAEVRLDGPRDQRIPELSAVKTNVQVAAGRFWYTLPPFTDRHKPDVLIPRVNSRTPEAWLNPGRDAIVDANFSSVWLTPSAALTPHALLAVLNSTWCRAAMELTGAVLGGGALKLEAVHLRRLPVPPLSPEHVRELSGLGERIALGDGTAKPAVDALVADAIDMPRAGRFTDQVAAAAAVALRGRSRRRGRANNGNADQ